MQDLCKRISCAYLCVRISKSESCMTTCARSLYALAQDLSVRMSASGWCRTTCKISAPGSLAQDPSFRISASAFCDTRSPQRVALRNRERNFTSIPRARHPRFPQRVCLSKPCFRSTAPAKNYEPTSYEMLHWPRKSILQLQFQKRYQSQELTHPPQNIGFMVRIPCARHVKRNPLNE